MALLYEELTKRIIAVYYEVYAELGHGFLEKIYQLAMIIALADAGMSVSQRTAFEVRFRGRALGNFFPDIVVDDKILLEIKSTSAISAYDDAQAINYLRASPLEVALIMNFGPKREFRRRLLTNDQKARARGELSRG